MTEPGYLMHLGDADAVDFVFASADGPRVAVVVYQESALDPQDPRQPGDIILRTHRATAQQFADTLANAAEWLRDSHR